MWTSRQQPMVGRGPNSAVSPSLSAVTGRAYCGTRRARPPRALRGALGGPEMRVPVARVGAAVCATLAGCAGMFLGVGCTVLAADEFTFPALESQPVAVTQASRSDEHYTLVVQNRSPRTVREIEFVFAGVACTRPYKPVWPLQTRTVLNIQPGASGSVEIPLAVIDHVAERSLRSCGRTMATEIAVNRVRFADESVWDLGDRVRAGEKYAEP